MVYSNSYMFLGIGVFVILSSHALANHLASEPLIYDRVQDDIKGIDYVKDPKNNVYKMPPEPPTYPEINGEALDDQKVDQEYVKAQAKEEALDLNEQKVVEYNAQKIEEALGEQKALEYVTAQKLEEILDDQKNQEYVKTHKSEEALDEEMVLKYLKAAHKFAEALDDHKGQEYVKAHKFVGGEGDDDDDEDDDDDDDDYEEEILQCLNCLHARKLGKDHEKDESFGNERFSSLGRREIERSACESPPNPLTGLKINEEALDDQKDQEYVKAQKIAACESPPNPLTDHKINEALDDQKDQEINGNAPKIGKDDNIYLNFTRFIELLIKLKNIKIM
ncbi:sarcoplasmic reticulum histidine-rich calcium-binding protein-like isoform X3 [Trifolium pratense]|uniref:sarcoplasmic reticulum histidine-rich calcium-binding protein-like isoform X3 n=1 Tax=Trifolium pratense TaxID=57577 RepID=UPI001E6945D9|nr:sarcoplasmic reticulum histidine-rich calcium-binding protein-like isoform X3 [Trifolium pratense]